MRLTYLAAAWALGIYVGSHWAISWGLAVGLAAPCLLLSLSLKLKGHSLLPGVALALLFLGMVRYQASLPDEGYTLAKLNGSEPVELVGTIVSDPETSGSRVRFELGDISEGNSQGATLSGKALVYARPLDELLSRRTSPYFKYGDRIRLEGTLETPQPFSGFDYREYLERQGITSVVYRPHISLIAEGHGARPLQWLYTVRQRMANSLKEAIPEPQGSLAQAMLLGLQRGIPEDTAEAFRRTGTSHLLAISGLNIGIVLGLMLLLSEALLGRRRQLYLLPPLVLLWLYVFLAGASPSLVRAAIMGSLVLAALALGRSRRLIAPLAAAAAVMLALEPQLMWHPAFQLSFLAMAGIVFLGPLLNQPLLQGARWLAGGQGWLETGLSWIAGGLGVSLAAVLATWPITAFQFQQVSLVSVPTTLLALPALPFILVLSLLTGGLGIWSQTLGQAAGWLAWLPLTYLDGVVRLFDALPGATWEAGTLATPLLWAYYGLVFVLVAFARKLGPALLRQGTSSLSPTPLASPSRTPLRQAQDMPLVWLAIPLAMATILVWVVVFTAREPHLQVTVLDVGQGNAVFIRDPQGHQVLVDGGPDPRTLLPAISGRMPFWDRSLDLVVVSHPDEDHLAGLIEVVQRYEVARVMESGAPCETDLCRQWRAILNAEGVPVITAQTGAQVAMGDGVLLQVLGPQRLPPTSGAYSDNDYSLVLRLSYGRASFLLPGDIEIPGAAMVQELQDVQSAVLLVPHHGSRSSLYMPFLGEVAPLAAVISAGQGNPYGHPHDEVKEALQTLLPQERILVTIEKGSIDFATDGERLWIKTER